MTSYRMYPDTHVLLGSREVLHGWIENKFEKNFLSHGRLRLQLAAIGDLP